MWNYPSYNVDTDLLKQIYHNGKTNATKQILNSFYGIQGDKTMNREYISVIVDGEPTVIFKRNIVAVTKKNENVTKIICLDCNVFYTKEDYASVVKKIIGKGV